MKYMIISDIHGDIYSLNKVLDIYVKEKCLKLVILGDLFNYGIDLNREDIINRLNQMKNSIICVRGNCDNNINGILFDIPYTNSISINNKNIFITHGHLYNKNYLINLDANIILTGHTHISNIKEVDNKILINPGSISKSRSGENSFAIIDESSVSIKNLNNEILQVFNFKY